MSTEQATLAPAVSTPRIGSTIARLVRLAGRQRREILTGLALRGTRSLSAGVPVALVVLLIRDLRAAGLTEGRATGYISVALVATLLQYVLGAASNQRIWRAAYASGQELRHDVLAQVSRLPLAYHQAHATGDSTTVVARDIAAIENYLGWTLPNVVGAAALPVGVLGILVVVDLPLALVATASLALAAPVLRWSLGRYARLARDRSQLDADLTARVVEFVQGLQVVRAFNLAEARHGLLQDSLDRLRQQNRTIIRAVVPAYSAFTTVVDLGIPLLLLAVGRRLQGGALDAATALAFLVLVVRVYQPLLDIAERAEMLPVVDASARRIQALLTEPPMPEPTCSQPRDGLDITLSDVTFAYRAGQPVLCEVSLDVAAGTMTAIVGPSGAGKSTLLGLLARFFDPSEGSVQIGGVDLRDMASQDVADLVTVVFQDVQLFTGTVWDNIAFGDPSAPDDAVRAAAEAAGCRSMAQELPEGYDTPVGEGGARLSGGERQRVSLARALLKDAPIVLLDEATSAVDPTTERDLQRGLARLVRGKTLVVAAHRLSTISSADQIVVLDEGCVSQRGQHGSLLTQGGLYADLWAQRQRAEGWRLAPEPPRTSMPEGPGHQATPSAEPT